MTLQQLHLLGKIRIRAFNACNKAEIETISDLKKYFKNFGSFKSLVNIGDKTNQELLKILDTYRGFIIEEPEPIDENSISYLIKNLTNEERQIVNEFILYESLTLSVRARNSIKLFLNGKLNVDDVSLKILSNDRFRITNIKNAGNKTYKELEKYFKSIESFTRGIKISSQ